MLQVKVGPNSVSPNPCVSSAQDTAPETLFELRLCLVATWPSFSSPISVLDVSFLLNGTAHPDHAIENCTFLLIPLSCFTVIFPQSADHLWGGLIPSTSYLFTIFIVYCLYLLAGTEVATKARISVLFSSVKFSQVPRLGPEAHSRYLFYRYLFSNQ